MSIAASLAISFAGRGAARRFEAAARDPVATQHRKLMEIVERNRFTEYGMEHGFSSVKSLEDYRALTPVITYQDIEGRMDRVVAGAKNVLTAEDPVMFAQTSGTTGKPKFIPVTPTCQGRDHADQMRTWLYHALRDHPGMLRGRVVSLVSPAVEGHTKSGIPFGSTSGHMYRNIPAIVRRTYAIPYEVFEIEDYETKYYVVMRLAVASDVTFLCTANPSSIMKMCEIADQQSEALLRDIADGTVRGDLKLPAATRRLVQERVRPARALARKLEEARSRRGGKLLPADYWPRLELIGCWKGGTVCSYLERFPEWFDPEGRRPVPVRDWGYLSSEARGSIPLTDEGCGGVLTVATNVYEFVEVEEVDRAPDDSHAWTFLGVDGVEEGKEYYIFLTTTGGLYRYDINDVIAVEGTWQRTPVIVFRRKGRGVTSITGEKVSVNQVIDAIEAASKEVGVAVDHFRAEADQKGARYIFKVESAKGIAEERRKELLEGIDRRLSALNLEYDAKRKSMRLNPPVLHVMKPGWYDAQKKAQIAEGKRAFQAKTVLLATRKEETRDREKEDREMLLAVVTTETETGTKAEAR